MYYCEKCGEKIDDLNKVCPTCGMYLNTNNSDDKSRNKSFFNYVLIFGFLFLIVISVIVVSYSYTSSVTTLTASNFTIEYEMGTWTLNKNSNDEYIYLQYNENSNIFLQIPRKATELHKDLEDDDVRKDLHSLYLMELMDSANISYTNVMAEIKKLDDSNYYYLSADYLQYTNVEYNGKVYLLHSSDGEMLCILLNLDGVDIDEVEEDVFKLFRNMDI